MSGDYHTHVDRKYEELIMRQSAAWKAIDMLTDKLNELETKVNDSKLMMKRAPDGHYERLVDVVCDHEACIQEIIEYKVGDLES